MQRKKGAKSKAGDASKLRIGVVVSSYNPEITDALYEGTRAVLKEWRVQEKNIFTLKVPGSFEIPYGCAKIIKRKKPDAVIALGCLVKGETKHDEHIATAVAGGIMRLSLEHAIPVAFGVLTTNNLAQARARSRGERNKGREAAVAALQSALV